jgi:hypothetical protein
VSHYEELPDSAEFCEFKMHAQKKLAERASQYVKTRTSKAAVAARVSALKGDTPIGPEPTSSMWHATPAPQKGKRKTCAAPNPFRNDPSTLTMTWSDPITDPESVDAVIQSLVARHFGDDTTGAQALGIDPGEGSSMLGSLVFDQLEEFGEDLSEPLGQVTQFADDLVVNTTQPVPPQYILDGLPPMAITRGRTSRRIMNELLRVLGQQLASIEEMEGQPGPSQDE